MCFLLIINKLTFVKKFCNASNNEIYNFILNIFFNLFHFKEGIFIIFNTFYQSHIFQSWEINRTYYWNTEWFFYLFLIMKNIIKPSFNKLRLIQTIYQQLKKLQNWGIEGFIAVEPTAGGTIIFRVLLFALK